MKRSDPIPRWAEPSEVADAMRTAVVTCRPHETLLEVAQRMELRSVGFTPVLAGASGRRVVGVLTEGDLCRALGRGARPSEVHVEAAMGEVARCCWADDSLEAAEAIMRAHGVRRLPVVDPAGDLVGVLSLSDVARSAAFRSIDSDRRDQVVETYAATSRAPGPA